MASGPSLSRHRMCRTFGSQSGTELNAPSVLRVLTFTQVVGKVRAWYLSVAAVSCI